MGFFERIKKGIQKIKTKLIVYAILVLILIVVLVAPVSASIVDGESALNGIKWYTDPYNGEFWSTFISSISTYILNPMLALKKCFTIDYIGTFASGVKIALVVFVLFAIIGLAKAIPKHEYQDIENGSSDWCEGGEQYKVLSKNKGIVLAEKNYLPVDKRGNVNVLVVRRFWSW